MVSLPYVFIAANKSSRSLVMLGDFRQLPPISMAEDNEYFRNSIFDFLDISEKIDKGKKVPYMVMLDTQYRMNKDISEIISKTFYNGLLKCGVKEKNKDTLNFINIDNSTYKDTYLSISDESYFNPVSLIIVDDLLRKYAKSNDEILLLSPFRPQQNLLNVMILDNNANGRSLTIHKSQGSESDIVVFDLTTHVKSNLQNYHHFFISNITKNLVNVAISRTKKQLYIIGSLEMMKDLAINNKLWKDLYELFKNKFNIIEYMDIFKKKEPFDIESENLRNRNTFTVVDTKCDKNFYKYILNANNIERRNYISKEGCIPSSERKLITFRDMKKTDKIPSMIFIDEIVILNENEQYKALRIEKTSKVLQRIALEKFIDTVEVGRTTTFTLNCERCGNNYSLVSKSGYVCLSCKKCHNQKNIGRSDALLIRDLYKIKCPDCDAEVTPRQKKGHSNYSFFGCSNYPHCQGMVSMSKMTYSY